MVVTQRSVLGSILLKFSVMNWAKKMRDMVTLGKEALPIKNK